MKLSFAISFQDSRFKAKASKNWMKRVEELAHLGYDGVEIGIRDPEKVNVGKLEGILTGLNLQLSAIGSGASYTEDGLSISSPRKEVRERAIVRVKGCIDIAKVFQSQVIIGLIRENKEASREELFENFIQSLEEILEYATFKDVLVTLEPINRYEVSFLNRVDEVVRFIEGFGYKNLKMMLDTFHMEVEEEDFLSSIKMSRDYLSHFHFADTGRKVPGEGNIDFRKVVEELKKIEYKGFLSAEIVLFPNFEVCARNWIERIRTYL